MFKNAAFGILILFILTEGSALARVGTLMRRSVAITTSWIGGTSVGGGSCGAGTGQFTGQWCSGTTSVSGSSNGMMSGARGVAADPTNDSLIVVDGVNQRIQK